MHVLVRLTVRWELAVLWWGTAECPFGAPGCVSGPHLGCTLHFSGRSPEQPHGGDQPPEPTAALPLWPAAPCSPASDCMTTRDTHQLGFFRKQCVHCRVIILFSLGWIWSKSSCESSCEWYPQDCVLLLRLRVTQDTQPDCCVTQQTEL